MFIVPHRKMSFCQIWNSRPNSVRLLSSSLEILMSLPPPPPHPHHHPVGVNWDGTPEVQMLKTILNDYTICLLNADERIYRLCVSVIIALEFDRQNDLCRCYHFQLFCKLLLETMNPLLNTGNSTRLTGYSPALCLCRGCLSSWSCLKIKWFSLQAL